MVLGPRYPLHRDSPHRVLQLLPHQGRVIPPFPLLFDETQDVARAYDAVCTPDFFLFDRDRRLVYRGQLDDSRPNRGTADGRDLRAAIGAVLAGAPVAANQKPSSGCGIKWKRG